MKRTVLIASLIALTVSFPIVAHAKNASLKKGTSVKEVKAMSEKDQTALALSAAPAHVAKEAYMALMPLIMSGPWYGVTVIPFAMPMMPVVVGPELMDPISGTMRIMSKHTSPVEVLDSISRTTLF